MILADTTIWIDFFRGRSPEMAIHLSNQQIVTHPLVIAELALGSLEDRRKTLTRLERLTQVEVAHLDEVCGMIEAHSLYSKGIGLIDAHLIASCLLTSGTQLWTRNIGLANVAAALGIHANFQSPRFN